jgi:deoxyribodipyrimidine photo-lyase
MTTTADQPIAVFWFRRDLRLNDNCGLSKALLWAKENSGQVLPLFIFDRDILGRLEDKDDSRVSFLHQTIQKLSDDLKKIDKSLVVRHGKVQDVWKNLVADYPQIKAVFFNHDYEPLAIARDLVCKTYLEGKNIKVETFKDQVLFERDEIQKDAGGIYTVYTPYSKKWRSHLAKLDQVPVYACSGGSQLYFDIKRVLPKDLAMPSLSELGFTPSAISFPGTKVESKTLANYAKQRDFPALDATSRLSLHLRFGTVSARKLISLAQSQKSDTWLGELIWREFFMQILANHPRVAIESFRPEYENIKWRNDEVEFASWCEGRTGYCLVDAGMRELNQTGFMHNRVRMVAASFLVKHLLIDYKWGEAYFARKLLDFELSSNNGNWQWVAGTGCDAAPYFRVFNPMTQAEKFDGNDIYIKKWVPEYGTPNYPAPIVDHPLARARVLAAYAAVRTQARADI